LTTIGAISTIVANSTRILEFLGLSSKPPMVAQTTVTSSNQSGGVAAGTVNITDSSPQSATASGPDAKAINVGPGGIYHAGPSKAEIVAAMEEVYQRNMAEIRNGESQRLDERYPLGYAIFTLTDVNEVRPFRNNDGEKLGIDWNDFKMSVEEDRIRLLGPSITGFGSKIVLGFNKGHGNYYTFPRRVGAGVGLVRADRMGIRADVLATKNYGTVLVVGAVVLDR